MPKEKKPQTPKGDRFTCRVCRHKHDTATEHAGDRVCKECAEAKMSVASGFVPSDPGKPTGEVLASYTPSTITPTITFTVENTPDRITAAPRPKPIPFDDASIIADLEEPEPFPLEYLLRNRITAKLEGDVLKTRIDHYNKELLPFFKRNKLSGVVYDDSTVAVMTGRKPTIKKELLLEFLLMNGFTAEESNAAIVTCTVSAEFETVAVRGPKEEKSGEAVDA